MLIKAKFKNGTRNSNPSPSIHKLPEPFVQYLLDEFGPFILPQSISGDDALPQRIHNPKEDQDYQVLNEGFGD